VNCTARIRTIRPYGDILPHGWSYGAWKYGCLFARVDFISRAIPPSRYPSGPLHASRGPSYTCSATHFRLGSICPMVQNNKQGCIPSHIKIRDPASERDEDSLTDWLCSFSKHHHQTERSRLGGFGEFCVAPCALPLPVCDPCHAFVV
jgi:hypothetical protein